MDVLYFNSRFVFGKGREIGPSWISGKLSRRIVARQNSKQIQIDGVVEKWCLMFVQMPPKFRFWGFWRFIYKGQKQTMKNVLFLLTFETYLNFSKRITQFSGNWRVSRGWVLTIFMSPKEVKMRGDLPFNESKTQKSLLELEAAKPARSAMLSEL